MTAKIIGMAHVHDVEHRVGDEAVSYLDKSTEMFAGWREN